MQTALRTFLISVPYIPKSVRIAKHSLFPRRSSKLCSSRVLKFFIVSFPFVYSRILTRLFPFGKYIRSIPTPHTGFERRDSFGILSGLLRSPCRTRFAGLESPPLQGLELKVTMDQRFSRPLPHHPDIRLIRAMRIELILTGSKPDAKSGFLRNPIAPLTGFGVPLRYAPITTAEGLEPPMQFSCNTGTRSRRLTN